MIADPTICKRPLVPASCPQQIHAVMNECIKHEPTDRPILVDLDIRLRNLEYNKIFTYMVSDLVVE